MRKSTTAAFVSGIAVTAVLGGGTAFAATGGTFLLGHSNTVKATTTLTSTHGAALALRAKAGKPALSVNTKGLVSNPNADLLDGQHASGFLPVNGQAADSAKLGGKNASSFLPVNGQPFDS